MSLPWNIMRLDVDRKVAIPRNAGHSGPNIVVSIRTQFCGLIKLCSNLLKWWSLITKVTTSEREALPYYLHVTSEFSEPFWTHVFSFRQLDIAVGKQCNADMGFECLVRFVYWCIALFDDFRYSDEQIPGVLYASVNPEYVTSTDGITYL